VREVPVESHSHAEPGEQVERQGQDDVGPVQAPAPGDRYRRDQGEQGDDDEHLDQEGFGCGLAAFENRFGMVPVARFGGRMVEC
jgi:hypothetical protein